MSTIQNGIENRLWTMADELRANSNLKGSEYSTRPSFAISVLFISCGFIKTDLKVNHSSATTNQKVTSPSKQVQSTQTD